MALGKDEFIKGILDKAGFEGLNVNFCMHHREWEAYHRIRKEQIFALSDIQYNPYHPSITDPKHYHFVLYQGTAIIGVAHVEFLSDEDCALRPFAIDAPYQNQGLGSQFLSIIKNGLNLRGKRSFASMPIPQLSLFMNALGMFLCHFKTMVPALLRIM